MRDLPISARRAWWFPAMALAIVLVLTWAPVVAAGVNAAAAQDAPSTSTTTAVSDSKFTGVGMTQKFAQADTPDAGLASTLPKRNAPVPVKVSPGSQKSGEGSHSDSDAQLRTASNTVARATSAPTPAKTQPSSTASGSGVNEENRARAILASLTNQYPILAGTTVSIASTPGGYQAVAYYKSGRIVVSPDHRASLERILSHEIWHVIDWRDNGRIDWGESVPPK